MNGSSSQVIYHEWVWGAGGNLQKACAETESSMLGVHGDTLWGSTVMDGKGRVELDTGKNQTGGLLHEQA